MSLEKTTEIIRLPVLATEAFDMAANATAFPEQVSAPRYNRGISNYGEGLRPWQPKKLYFFSDSNHPDFLKGRGPVCLASEVSRTKHVPYSEINREAWKAYATQLDFDEKTLREFADAPEYLVLGKSLVHASAENDIFAGIDDEPIGYAPPQAKPEVASSGITLTLGGPWFFYQQFYRAHGLGSLLGLVAPPQTALGDNHQLWIPLLLHNHSAQPQDITLQQVLPEGWKSVNPPGAYHLEPGESWPVQLFLVAPSESGAKSSQLLHWTALDNGKPVASAKIAVYLEYNGVPQ